jgi:hypothetical protein
LVALVVVAAFFAFYSPPSQPSQVTKPTSAPQTHAKRAQPPAQALESADNANSNHALNAAPQAMQPVASSTKKRQTTTQESGKRVHLQLDVPDEVRNDPVLNTHDSMFR